MANKPSPQDILAAVGNGPPVAGRSVRQPIGVPSDFVTVVQKPGFFGPPRRNPDGSFTYPGQVAKPPSFFEGDENLPAVTAPEKIAMLQRQMASVGLIGPKVKFRLGVWDEPTRNAYRDLLAFANSRGMDDDRAALDVYANSQAAMGADITGEQPEREPLVKRLPNPDDLRATFDTVARATLGHKADDALIGRMVSSYQQAVGTQQEALYNAGAAGGTVTEPADPRTYAEQQIRSADPNAAAAHDAVGLYGDFLKLWSGRGDAA